MTIFLTSAKWLVLVLLLVVTALVLREQPRIRVSSEYVCFYLLRGGYRSWVVNYSWGHQLQPDGTWKNIWKSPTFYRTDIRKLLKSGRVREWTRDELRKRTRGTD